MEHLSLDEIIQKGEGQALEFKKSLSLQGKGFESLCAMVNSALGSGTVIFGIDPHSAVSGIEPGNLDSAQRSLSQQIRNKFEPPLAVSIKSDTKDGRQVIIVSAERRTDIPYHEYDGRAWIREGSTNRLLSLAEKESLIEKRNRDRHPGPWKCNRCGSLVGILVSYEINDEGIKKTYKCSCGGEFWPIE